MPYLLSTPWSSYRLGGGIEFMSTSNKNIIQADASVAEEKVRFIVSNGASTNGKTESSLRTNGTEFYITGYVVYK